MSRSGALEQWSERSAALPRGAKGTGERERQRAVPRQIDAVPRQINSTPGDQFEEAPFQRARHQPAMVDHQGDAILPLLDTLLVIDAAVADADVAAVKMSVALVEA